MRHIGKELPKSQYPEWYHMPKKSYDWFTKFCPKQVMFKNHWKQLLNLQKPPWNQCQTKPKRNQTPTHQNPKASPQKYSNIFIISSIKHWEIRNLWSTRWPLSGITPNPAKLDLSPPKPVLKMRISVLNQLQTIN